MSKFLLFGFVFVFTCALADAQVTRLTFEPVDTSYSLALDRVIFVSARPNQLHIYNPVTQADQVVGLAEVPLNLSVSPDGLHAAVAFSDAVAYVDLQAGTVARTFSNVAVGTGQVVVGTGYVYVMPKYNAALLSINIATGLITTQTYLTYASGGVFDPLVSAIYTTDVGSPSSVSMYDTAGGIIGSAVSQPRDYFGVFSVCGPLWLSRDGAAIYSACGAVYRSSLDPAKNLHYLGSLPGLSSRVAAIPSIQSLTASDTQHQIAAIPAIDTDVVQPNPLTDTVVKLLDSSSFNEVGTLATTPFLVDSLSFPAHARWVFYNSASSALIIVTQADISAALAPGYAIETVDLSNANSCGARFGSTSGSAIAAGSYGTAQILSGEDCLFTAASNVPWIVLSTGYSGSGNTTLTYLVRPNLTTSTRPGTISIDSQTYTVTQAAAGPSLATNSLSFKPVAADYDKALDKIVMVSASPNELHIYDPVTQADQITPLSYQPLSVSVRPDGSFAAVGHSGHISVVNLQANSVSKVITVDMDAAGILLAANGYAYAFPPGQTNGDINSVETTTGTSTPLANYTNDGNSPRLDASGNYLYVGVSDIYSVGNSKLDIRNGPATEITGLSNAFNKNIWLSEDGTHLLDGRAYAVFTSTDPAQDLQPEGRLSSTDNVDWAANSQVQHQTAILTDPVSGSSSAQLQIYSDPGLQLVSQIPMPDFLNSGTSYLSHGKYIFWNAAASKLFAITEADSTSGLLSDFAEMTVTPGSVAGCTYNVSPNTLNVPAAPGGIWFINVTTNCSWMATSDNTDWLSIGTFNAFVIGNGQFSFGVDFPNSGAARSAAINIGSQTVHVNQAASTCTYSISYNSQGFTQAGGTGQVGLMTAAGCPWSVQSNSSWLTVVGSELGVGPANIQFSVAPNTTGNVTYPGTLNIAGNSFTVSQTTIPVSSALNFIPVTPCRLFDTRILYGGYVIRAGTTFSYYAPQSACNIPSTALAYSLNITAIPHGPLSYITVWPDSDPQPLVSTLNANDGRIKANAAIVGGGANGRVDFYATNDTGLAVDIDGYFVDANSNTGLEFYPLTPCRLVDTRNGDGPLGGPSMVEVQSRDFPFLQSNCSLPSSVGAYSLNFTAVPEHGSPLEYISVWPSGQSQPLVSTLNAPRGNIVANAGIVQAGTGGDVNVAATNNSDLVIDLNGYFAAPGSGGLHLYTVAPCRVLDTRATGNDQPFSGTLFVQMTGNCSIPSNAEAVVLNATAVPAGPLAYITLWPSGVNQPLVSTLNAGDGRITSNMAIVPLGSGGINAFATSNTHLVLDVNGYFAP